MNLINGMLYTFERRKEGHKKLFVARGYMQRPHKTAQTRFAKLAISVFAGIVAGLYFYGQTTASEVASQKLISGPSMDPVIVWVSGENKTSHGLEIKFFVSEQVEVKILDQGDSYLRLLFAGADEMDVSSMRLAGISSYPSTDGINVGIDLDETAEFQVYQNYHADQFTIIVAMQM